MRARLRRRQSFAALARLDLRHGVGKCRPQVRRRGQRIAIEGLAEVGELALVVAPERGPVGRGGRDDDGVIVAQVLDERAGVAGGDHHHLPADAGFAQHSRQSLAGEPVERKRAVRDHELRVALAMRRQREEQHVPLAIHALRGTVERALQGGRRRQRVRVVVTAVVHEG